MKQIDHLAEAYLLADSADRNALMDLRSRCFELHRNLEEAGETTAAQETWRMCKALEQLAFEECSAPQETWSEIGNHISRLQAAQAAPVPETASQAADPQQDSGSTLRHPGQLPENLDEAIFLDFLKRQKGFLEEMEAHILGLEQPGETGHKEELQRQVHTLKGEAGLLGLDEVQRLCHKAEDLLDLLEPTTITDTLLEVRDWLGMAFSFYKNEGPPPPPAEGLHNKLEVMLEIAHSTAAKATPNPPQGKPLEGDPELLKDFVTESLEHLEIADLELLNLETDPDNAEALNAIFRAFHTMKGISGYLGLDEISRLSHEVENLLERLRKGTIILSEHLLDTIFDSVDMMKRLVRNVQIALKSEEGLPAEMSLPRLLNKLKQHLDGSTGEPPVSGVLRPPLKKLGELLVENGAMTREELEQALAKQATQPGPVKLGEMLIKEGKMSAKDIARSLRGQKAREAAQASQEQPLTRENSAVQENEAAPMSSQMFHNADVLRIDAERLDRLIDTIGELVITESMFSRALSDQAKESPILYNQLNRMDKITRELQEMSTALRMVSLKSTFQKMARLVRDLSHKSGKQIDFVITGEDTELDKSMVEMLGDPLVHMLRNGVDHGIENSPEERKSLGKDPTGRIELKAYHKGGHIYIEVSDDGRGIDPDKILARAIRQGLVAQDADLKKHEILDLIFAPGFSSADTVTDVSGRGIGMDVVKRNIDYLRGKIDIRSETGQGTTFVLALPLTLAIIDGMIIQTGCEQYIIPALSVLRVFQPKASDINMTQNRGEMIKEQGEYIPLIRLSNIFEINDAYQDPTQCLAVIVKHSKSKLGLLTDKMIGLQQIVIKSLGKALEKLRGVSGSAILSDGSVGLILDTERLLELSVFDSSAVESETIEVEQEENEPAPITE